jgi:hypothetical protein
MKRATFVVLLLLLAATSAGASYKIALTDGTYINADDKPVLKEGLAYFSKDGLFLYLSAAKVDLAKTDEINMVREVKDVPVIEEIATAPKSVSVKPVFVDDSMLDIIRQRSRLANEGQFERPGLTEGTPGTPAAGGEATAEGGAAPNRAALQDKLTGLLSQRGTLQGQVDQMQTQLSDLQDRYNFSTQQGDRQSLQGQIDGLNGQLAQTRSQLAAVNNDALSVQQELARQPVTVEVKP